MNPDDSPTNRVWNKWALDGYKDIYDDVINSSLFKNGFNNDRYKLSDIPEELKDPANERQYRASDHTNHSYGTRPLTLSKYYILPPDILRY